MKKFTVTKNMFLNANQSELFQPAELKRFARDWIDQNPNLFSSLKTAYQQTNVKRAYAGPTRVIERQNVGSDAVTKEEIRRVVQRNILDEYNHPQIVEAVATYLHDHFSRS